MQAANRERVLNHFHKNFQSRHVKLICANLQLDTNKSKYSHINRAIIATQLDVTSQRRPWGRC